MPVDRTAEFRTLLSEARVSVPEAKRRKLSGRSTDAQSEKDTALNKEYLAEAYAVVRPTRLLELELPLNHTTRM